MDADDWMFSFCDLFQECATTRHAVGPVGPVGPVAVERCTSGKCGLFIISVDLVIMTSDVFFVGLSSSQRNTLRHVVGSQSGCYCTVWGLGCGDQGHSLCI